MAWNKLNSQVQEAICLLIAHGVSPDTACESQGIDRATFYRWKERGARALKAGDAADPADLPFRDFYEQISRCHARVNGELQKNIIKAGKDDWRASAYMLGKRMPKEFGERATLEVEAVRLGKGRALSAEAAEEIKRKILFGDHTPRPPAVAGSPAALPAPAEASPGGDDE
jgi:hypothetical protein